MKRGTSVLSMSAVLLSVASLASAGTLTLTIDTKETTGTLRAAVYDSQASFENQTRVAGTTSTANGGSAIMTFDGLEPGAYGIAVFLDTNGNDRLDRNLFGAPTEPYGFSMNPKIAMSAPKFDAFRFDHDGSDQQITIQLNGN